MIKQTYHIQTKKDAIRIAKEYSKIIKVGDIVALHGNLGVGKTFFVQNICNKWHINDQISSPSYVLLNQYGSDLKINHYDLYRIQFPDECFELGILENHVSVITFIEWPEIVMELLPKTTYHFYFTYGSEKDRFLTVIREID